MGSAARPPWPLRAALGAVVQAELARPSFSDLGEKGGLVAAIRCRWPSLTSHDAFHLAGVARLIDWTPEPRPARARPRRAKDVLILPPRWRAIATAGARTLSVQCRRCGDAAAVPRARRARGPAVPLTAPPRRLAGAGVPGAGRAPRRRRPPAAGAGWVPGRRGEGRFRARSGPAETLCACDRGPISALTSDNRSYHR